MTILLHRSIVIYFFILSNNLSAQNIHFTYDEAGNRLSKSLVTFMSRAKYSGLDNAEGNYTDLISEVAISLNNNLIAISFLKYNDSIDGDIMLNTTDGKLLRKLKVHSPMIQLNMDNYLNGVYVISVRINGRKQSWKVQKR